MAARAGHSNFLSAFELHLLREFERNFHKRLRHQLHVHGIVLGPVVIVLGQPIRRADHLEFLLGHRPYLSASVLYFFTTGFVD